MAIKELDQDTVKSIYNKFIFTAKPETEVLDKKSVVSISNNLTSIQNAFNVLVASVYNVGKLNQYNVKRQQQLLREKTIEGTRGFSNSISGGQVDFTVATEGLGLLAKYFEEINQKLEKLDLAGTADQQSAEVDVDLDRRRSRAGGRMRTAMRFGGRALGVAGVGLDVVTRLAGGQSLGQTLLGVGGGLAGAAGGAKLGAKLGSFAGPIGTVAGGLIGGLGGYFAGGYLADRAYQAVAKPELSETSYSFKFADFLKNSINAAVRAFPVISGAAILGRSLYDRIVGTDNGPELPANAGVLDAIAKAEGTYGANGYNTSLANGAYLPGGKEQNLTNKTLDEILQLQKYMLNNPENRFNSSALGRYQIVSTTLRAAAAALKMDTRTTKFDPQTQDRMAMWILKKQGFGAWEGFKRKPEYLQFAQTALKEGRIKGPEMVGNGTFASPTRNNRLTSPFGPRPDSPEFASKFHEGLDFGATRPGVAGDPIYAAKSGEVTSYTGARGSYGNIVEIDHGDGFKTRYAHLSSINVGIGEKVAAGQFIGVMGKTGDPRYDVHLHFEVLKNGRPINPAPLLGASQSLQDPKKNVKPADIQSYAKKYDGLLLDPAKKKKKPKVVVVEKPIYVMSNQGKRGPGSTSPQPPKTVSGKKIPYYTN